MPLVGYWPLNETSGSTARDYSGSGNDGEAKNSPTQGATGILGKNCYKFDGSSDYVSLPSLTFSNLTISCWMKSTANSLGSELLGVVSLLGDGYFAIVTGEPQSGDISFDLFDETAGNSGSHSYASWSNGTNNTWYHIVAQYDGSDQIIFVDGKRRDTNSSPVTPNYSGPNAIGRRDGTDHFKGKIADVRVYDHMLSRGEINYLHEVAQRGRTVTATRRG